MKNNTRYILLNSENIVTQIIETWKKPTDEHVESESGELGQIRQSDGTFIDPPIEEVIE